MLRSRRTVHWTLAHLWLACAVLAACATPQRSSRRDLRLDSETAAKVTHASAITEGASPMASTATAAVASTLGQAVPALLSGHSIEKTAPILVSTRAKSTARHWEERR